MYKESQTDTQMQTGALLPFSQAISSWSYIRRLEETSKHFSKTQMSWSKVREFALSYREDSWV